ncbi:glycogen synthase [Candidatus Parcubacteria bacterium]|nr:glycogen synthase [Candidatus Parcubacteria bacterium]
MIKKFKVLMVSAEVAPFAKAGGLADVVGSLPPALKKFGVDVRIVMPKYETIDEKKFKLKKVYENVEIPSNGKFVRINIWKTKLPRSTVTVYLIENKKYLGGKCIYKNGDNVPRFLFFSQAAMYSLPVIGFKPDVVHAHDYHTGIIPNIISSSDFEYFKDIKAFYTIHNLNYQGKTGFSSLKIANLTKKDLNLIGKKRGKQVNLMSEGIIGANQVSTVSPTYAREIMTKEYGAGLETLLRKNKEKLSGVLNGIDVNKFHPMKDKFIKKKFSTTSLKNKIANKLLLQKELGLPQDKNIAVVGLVTRLALQKGLELITEDLMSLNCQYVFLGTGQKKYEKYLTELAKKYPKKMSAKIMFDLGIARRIYASSDIFIIPSRYEPCGLTQMIAMRYGTVPVVRATGGLVDTVDAKVGFSFKPMSKVALKRTLKQALNIYYNKPKQWESLMKNGMTKDFSWDKSAKDYLKMYKSMKS